MMKNLLNLIIICNLVACASSPEQKDDTYKACPATPAQFRRCGCHPYEERIYNILSQAQIPENLRSEFAECISAGAGVGLGESANLSGSLKKCEEKKIKLDQQLKDLLISFVNQGTKYVDKEQIKSWQSCRDGISKKEVAKYIAIDMETKKISGPLAAEAIEASNIDNRPESGAVYFKIKGTCPADFSQVSSGKLIFDSIKQDGDNCAVNARVVDSQVKDKKTITDKYILTPVYLQNLIPEGSIQKAGPE